MQNMHQNRRDILKLGFLTGTSALLPASINLSQAQNLSSGIIDGISKGIYANSIKDQSRMIARALHETAAKDQILFLPAGDYYISNILLPDRARLMGVSGATKLIYTGGGHGLVGRSASRIELRDITIDGVRNSLGENAKGLLHITACPDLTLQNVEIKSSAKYGLYLERCGGIVEACQLTGAQDAALYAVESSGLTIRDNHVHDCDNGGILVHRWAVGEDGTVISGNRIARISATYGGTGPFGNGINVYRAGNVMIADNHISDCAFSAIRGNSASNIHITGNTCIGSGETALYVEFAFQGAVVTGNLIDGGTMGISIANFNENGRLSTISGNLVRNIVGVGPYEPKGSGFGHGIAVEADAAVTGNTIENVAKWGIFAGWGPYLRSVNIHGNVIRKAAVGVAVSVVDGIQSTSITNNVFDDVPGGAILGYRWHDAVTKDLALVPETGNSELYVSGNHVN